MQTVVEVDSLEELRTLLEKTLDSTIEAINFKYMGMDERNSWMTYMVTVDFPNTFPGCPVGWSDGIFDE